MSITIELTIVLFRLRVLFTLCVYFYSYNVCIPCHLLVIVTCPSPCIIVCCNKYWNVVKSNNFSVWSNAWIDYSQICRIDVKHCKLPISAIEMQLNCWLQSIIAKNQCSHLWSVMELQKSHLCSVVRTEGAHTHYRTLQLWPVTLRVTCYSRRWNRERERDNSQVASDRGYPYTRNMNKTTHVS